MAKGKFWSGADLSVLKDYKHAIFFLRRHLNTLNPLFFPIGKIGKAYSNITVFGLKVVIDPLLTPCK
jgi:hypothetical protein